MSHLFPPKVVSKPDPETGLFNPFPAFNFSGPLRPVYPLSERRKVPASIPHPDYAGDGIPKHGRSLVRSNKIECLDAKAQEGMRKVCRLAREVLDIAAAAIRPGITTDEIDKIVHDACIERNVRPTTHPPCSPGSRRRSHESIPDALRALRKHGHPAQATIAPCANLRAFLLNH